MVTTIYGRRLFHRHITEFTHHILIMHRSLFIQLPRSLRIIKRINQTLIYADFQVNRMSQSFPMIPSFWVNPTQLINDSLWIIPTQVDQWLPMSHFSRLPISLDLHVYKDLCSDQSQQTWSNSSCEYKTINPHLRASTLVSASFLLCSKILASESAIWSVCNSDSFALRLTVWLLT